MKPFLKIIAGALAVFMVLAVAQERDVFFAPLAMAAKKPRILSKTDRKNAVETVYSYLALSSHLYATGGDPRFAERIPASRALVNNILTDTRYIERNHRRQENRLMGLDVLSVTALPGGRVRVRTKEYWIVKTLWAVSGKKAGPTRSEILFCKYLVRREGATWMVTAWDFADDAEPTVMGSPNNAVVRLPSIGIVP